MKVNRLTAGFNIKDRILKMLVSFFNVIFFPLPDGNGSVVFLK